MLLYNFLLFKIDRLRYFHHAHTLNFFNELENQLLSKKLNNFMGVKLMLKFNKIAMYISFLSFLAILLILQFIIIHRFRFAFPRNVKQCSQCTSRRVTLRPQVHTVLANSPNISSRNGFIFLVLFFARKTLEMNRLCVSGST